MHSELLERCRIAREQIDVPSFPLASIRVAVARPVESRSRRRSLVAAILAGFSIVAIAAAAELVQTRITFQKSGLVTIAFHDVTMRPIHSDAEISAAAERLDFPVVLPTGLPAGTQPKTLMSSGTILLWITYNLAGEWRRSHHLLWFIIANPRTLSVSHAAADVRQQLHIGGPMRFVQWRVGHEVVIVASNGITAAELANIKRAMERAASGT